MNEAVRMLSGTHDKYAKIKLSRMSEDYCRGV